MQKLLLLPKKYYVKKQRRKICGLWARIYVWLHTYKVEKNQQFHKNRDAPI